MVIKSNKFHQLIAMTPVNLIEFMMGFGLGWTPTVLHWLRNRLTIEQISLIGSLYYVGRMVGPFILTILIDRIGRKKLFITGAALCFIQYAVLLSNKPETVWAQYVARLAMGLAAGIQESATGIYVGENCSPSSRAFFNVIVLLHSVVGMLAAYVMGAYCSYNTLNACAAIVSSAALVSSVFLLREPAQFLLMKGRTELAEHNFSWLRGRSVTAKQEFLQVSDYIDRVRNEVSESLWTRVRAPEAYRSLIIVVVLTLITMMSGDAAVCAYITIMMKDTNLSLSPNELTIVYGLGIVALLFVSTLINDRFSRRALFMFSNTMIVIISIVTAIMFMVDRDGKSTSMTVAKFVLLVLSSGIYTGIPFPLTAAVRGELLPQPVKAIGSALTIVVGSIGGFLLTNLFLPISNEFGIEYNFFMYTLFALGSIFLVYCFLPETHGKTLVQIQDELRERYAGGSKILSK